MGGDEEVAALKELSGWVVPDQALEAFSIIFGLQLRCKDIKLDQDVR
jgi:hypothetical protein